MIDRIDHIVMNCRDVEATASWYERALGFEREAYQSPAEPGQRIALKFGRQKFNLRPTGSQGGRPARSMYRAR
jgi:catechol 2,3-dioxygenase-like lactoylglutathione lyase family enzyme